MESMKQFYKSTMGLLEGLVHGFGTPIHDCVVLCLHSTPKAYMPQFQKIVRQLQKHYTVLGPHQFDSYLAGSLQDGPYLLLTFDDGIKNNWYAAEWLHSNGIGAYFFVVPNFITSPNQSAYYRTHIRPIVDHNFENAIEDFASLSLDELKKMLQMGHRIGSHSMSHLLNGQMNNQALKHELIDSKKWLSEELGVEVNSFCSPNNTAWSVNAEAKSMIEKTYAYHFTTFPGNQRLPREPLCIYRRNIEINWTWARIQFALGQWDLGRWKPSIEKFSKL